MNIKAGAAIANSKLNLATITQNITHSGTMTHSGVMTLSEALNENKSEDIASATTTDIGAADGNYVDVTGTTTITGFGTVQAGTRRIVQFDDALTLTHNGTSLILPGAANITTAAGDTACFVSLGSGNWKCAWYQTASGEPIAGGIEDGAVVNIVNTQDGAVATGTTVMPDDDSIPQNDEGDEYMTLAITPKSTTNKLKIEVVVYHDFSVGSGASKTAALFQDSTEGALACGTHGLGSSTRPNAIVFTHFMTAGTTSETTFKVRAGGDTSGTFTFNGSGGSRLYGGVLASSITITEIKAS